MTNKREINKAEPCSRAVNYGFRAASMIFSKKTMPSLVLTVAVLYELWTVLSKSAPKSSADKNSAEILIKSCKDDAASKGIWSKGDKILVSPMGEDNLSGLPDDILSSILSLLTLRDAVKMAKLSRSWRNVTIWLPILDLDWWVITGLTRDWFHNDNCERYRERYVEAVHQVLACYQNQEISSFRFSFCYDKEYAAAVDECLKFTTKKNIGSLALEFYCVDYRYPHCPTAVASELYIISSSLFFHFPNLKDLRLVSCVLKHHGELRFSGLVRLDLNYVILEGSQWQPILSRFSTIEWLRLRGCNLPHTLCIDDNLRRLSFLMITHCPDLREIILASKKLKAFEYVGDVAARCSFLSVSKMENVYIALSRKENNGVEGLFSELANSVFGLKILNLHDDDRYSMVPKLPQFPSTLFHSVLELTLTIKHIDHDIELVKDLPRLLQAFPLLQKLSMMVPYPFKLQDEVQEPPAVCLHTHLKDVELCGFMVCWIKVARYMLRSAIALDRLVIDRGGSIYGGCGRWNDLNYRFNRREIEEIRCALEGWAISPNLEVIIRERDHKMICRKYEGSSSNKNCPYSQE